MAYPANFPETKRAQFDQLKTEASSASLNAQIQLGKMLIDENVIELDSALDMTEARYNRDIRPTMNMVQFKVWIVGVTPQLNQAVLDLTEKHPTTPNDFTILLPAAYSKSLVLTIRAISNILKIEQGRLQKWEVYRKIIKENIEIDALQKRVNTEKKLPQRKCGVLVFEISKPINYRHQFKEFLTL
ncbi:unnamed protein product [Caenorhabditis angaria]|uniref:Uncharacterized protein n=1 Tax=Caenorhabditis angaria TaxID=860376 RepID=A0A9P1MXL4_9PELO|nr:unnamed protein product [Caenorhabditis angaria]